MKGFAGDSLLYRLPSDWQMFDCYVMMAGRMLQNAPGLRRGRRMALLRHGRGCFAHTFGGLATKWCPTAPELISPFFRPELRVTVELIYMH